jgi:UDP-N-acetylglucosamine diphosphorylase/glucosamine-1-phosphate N-acetyltransferase
MHVVIFEGSRLSALAPLSLSRPTFTLGAGTGTLLDKQIRFLNPTRLTLWVRPQFEDWCRAHIVPTLKIPVQINTPLDDEIALLTTGRTLYLARSESTDKECVVVEEEKLIRKAVVKRPGLSPEDVWKRTSKWLDLLELPQTMPQARFIDHPWDLINWNEEALIVDSMTWRDHAKPLAPDGPHHVINGDDVLVQDGAKLAPGCVLDASKGPVMIGKLASIGANAVIQGPCFIGPYAQISPVALIRPGTSIGPVCKVGGEVANSLIFGCSNKAHEGFLGDSYVGKWVNLGAGTTTSNLKNTYGEIEMQIGSKKIQTQRRFLGSIIGDHTKTAIGTRLNTGSYIGFNCMIATAGIAPKFVPSFSFLTDTGAEKYDINKAIEVAKQMFARRNRRWTDIEEKLMRYISETARDAEAAG